MATAWLRSHEVFSTDFFTLKSNTDCQTVRYHQTETASSDFLRKSGTVAPSAG